MFHSKKEFKYIQKAGERGHMHKPVREAVSRRKREFQCNKRGTWGCGSVVQLLLGACGCPRSDSQHHKTKKLPIKTTNKGRPKRSSIKAKHYFKGVAIISHR
jgi:hypothetical protein